MTGLTGSTENQIPAVREPLIMKVSGEQRESLLLILVMMIYGFHGTCRDWYLFSGIQMLIWFTRYVRSMVEDCGEWGNHLQLSRPVDMEFLRRVYLAGKQIIFCPQLSLLKFPSA